MSQPTDPQKVDLAQFASVDDAIEKAQESCAGLAPLAKRIIQVRQGTIYQSTIFMLSAIARAEGLARGVIHAVRTENPYVAFPLLRAYADVVMIVMYVRARPAYMQTVMNSPQNLPEGALGQRSTQAIIAAVGREAPGFKHVWDELCDMTHFGSLAIWNAWKLDPDPTEPGNVSYTTYPRPSCARRGQHPADEFARRPVSGARRWRVPTHPTPHPQCARCRRPCVTT